MLCAFILKKSVQRVPGGVSASTLPSSPVSVLLLSFYLKGQWRRVQVISSAMVRNSAAPGGTLAL